MVVGKFRVTEVANKPASEGECFAQVEMAAVVPGDTDNLEEDTKFHKYTPSGIISISVTNPEALEQFQPGDIKLVRFEDAS